MSGAAAAAAGHAPEPVDYSALEDPALHWVKLVDAFRTRDPMSVNRVLAVAKKSQWTGTLWAQEAEQMGIEEETDEEFDCGHAQCKESGTCLLEE
jgi:hypothetical protein